MKFEPETVVWALRKSWYTDTAKQWSKERPASGLCRGHRGHFRPQGFHHRGYPV